MSSLFPISDIRWEWVPRVREMTRSPKMQKSSLQKWNLQAHRSALLSLKSQLPAIILDTGQIRKWTVKSIITVTNWHPQHTDRCALRWISDDHLQGRRDHRQKGLRRLNLAVRGGKTCHVVAWVPWAPGIHYKRLEDFIQLLAHQNAQLRADA